MFFLPTKDEKIFFFLFFLKITEGDFKDSLQLAPSDMIAALKT